MFHPAARLAVQVGFRQQAGKQFQAAEGIANLMGQQSGHLDQRLLPAHVFPFLLQFLRLAYVAQDEDRSGMLQLQPGMADRDPDRLAIVVIFRLAAEKQFALLARFARLLKLCQQGRRQGIRMSRRTSQQPHCLGVEDRNARARLHHQYAAGQALHDPAQTLPDTAVLLQAVREVPIGDLQFLPQVSDLSLQLSISSL